MRKLLLSFFKSVACFSMFFLLGAIMKSPAYADTKTSADVYAKFDGLTNLSTGYFVGDVSGDNKPDLVMSDNAGNVYIYLNGNIPAGTTDLSTATNFNVKYTGVGNYFDNFAFAAVDVNNDGDNDLAINDDSEAFDIFLSTKIASYASSTGTVVNIDTTPSEYAFKIYRSAGGFLGEDGPTIYVDDIDDDNYNDIVVVADEAALYYLDSSIFRNVAAGTTLDLAQATSYTARISNNLLNERGNNMKLGDITNDGKPDIVFIADNGTYGTLNMLFGSALAAISGTGTNIDATVAANLSRVFSGNNDGAGLKYDVGIRIIDLTGDGKNDLIVANGMDLYAWKNETMRTWEGTSGVSQSLAVTSSYTFSMPSTHASWTFGSEDGIFGGDINGNNLPDLIIVEYYNTDGCTNCGSIYVVLDNLLSTFFAASSGSNSFPVATTSNYSARIRGDNGNLLGSNLGNGVNFGFDYNTDGETDLIIGSVQMDKEFVFLSDAFADLGTTTGTIWNVNDVTPAQDRVYDGFRCQHCNPYALDLTGDSANDFIVGNKIDDTVTIFKGGSKITNLPGTYTLNFSGGSDIDLSSVYFPGIVENLIIEANNKPVALVSASFDGMGTEYEWSAVVGGVDSVNGKSFIDLDAAAGIQGTHSLYIPALVGSTGVRICPSALNLTSVTENCAGVVTMLEGAAGLTKVTIGGYDYWRVDGLAGTGGMNVVLAAADPDEEGLPDTGVSEIGVIALSMLTLIGGVVGIKKVRE